jgi:hypothetical protein
MMQELLRILARCGPEHAPSEAEGYPSGGPEHAPSEAEGYPSGGPEHAPSEAEGYPSGGPEHAPSEAEGYPSGGPEYPSGGPEYPSGGIHSYDDLMARLSISRPLLEAMLESLSRLGYLQQVEGGCGGTCTGCHGGSCTAGRPGKIWALTRKGRKAAAG